MPFLQLADGGMDGGRVHLMDLKSFTNSLEQRDGELAAKMLAELFQSLHDNGQAG